MEVVGVAGEQVGSRVSRVQLAADQAAVPPGVLATSMAVNAVHVWVENLSLAEIGELETHLNRRYPRHAPFEASYVAAPELRYKSRLHDEIRQFSLAAVLIFALTVIGLIMVLHVSISSKVYVYALLRSFGASKKDTYKLIFRHAVLLTGVVGFIGIALGCFALKSWTARLGYSFALPISWLSLCIIVLLFIGCILGVIAARWGTRVQPYSLLRSEG